MSDDRLRRRGRKALRQLADATPGRRAAALKEVNRRLTTLEREVAEQRRLNRRLAELTDLVQELLVPLAERDEDKVKEYLDRYSAGL